MTLSMPSCSRKTRPRRPAARTRPTSKAKASWLADPDVRLMMRVRDGDDAAFGELAERYGARVLGYFCRQLGDRSEAEDLTQEVLMRLYRSRDRYEPRARFATWVFHITQNVARNALRSRRRHPSVYLDVRADDGRRLEALLADEGDSPSRPLERHELAGVVRAAVADLDGRQRTAMELHQFEDRTYAEVAAKLDMTPKAAKSLLYRARNQLRTVLARFMEQ
jgi:RNA polymerase sigma-70 factor, ECF subfamily